MIVGSWVRCERSTPARGTWSRYATRVGRVVVVNRVDGEYGVRFTAETRTVTWFVADELVVVAKAVKAPTIRLRGAGLQAPGSPLRTANDAER